MPRLRAWICADDYPAYDLAELTGDPVRHAFALALAENADAARLQPLLHQLGARTPPAVVDMLLCADALLRYNLGAEAESLLEGLTTHPDRAGARASAILAQRLFDRGEFLRARELAEGAARIAPEAAYCQLLLGHVRAWEGRHDAALAHFRRAHAIRPMSTRIMGDLAVALLGDGRITEGLSTWVVGDYIAGLYPQADYCPIWDGRPLAGARLLVVTYFGQGDIIQFMRFARMLRQREPEAHLAITIPDSLARVAAASGCFDAVHGIGVDRKMFDWQVSQIQLGLLLDATMSDISACVPYLAVPASLTAAAGTWLPPRRPGSRRVGLRWYGNAGPFDTKRSMPFEALRPLFCVPDIEWVALTEEPEQLERVASHPLLEASTRLGDFLDTAALVDTLDLVISVDTSVAHLSCALGLAVWVMARPDYEWRWGRNGEFSSWYPTARVFRHRAGFDWGAMVAEIEVALRRWRATPLA